MKNKRIIALIALLAAGVLCFAACAQSTAETQKTTATTAANDGSEKNTTSAVTADAETQITATANQSDKTEANIASEETDTKSEVSAAEKTEYEIMCEKYLPDENYKKVLDEMIPHGSEIMETAISFYCDKTVSRGDMYDCFHAAMLEKGYFNECMEYIRANPWETDISIYERAGHTKEKGFVSHIISDFPDVYRDYPNLDTEKYLKIMILVDQNRGFRRKYEEALAAGLVSENDKKLTLEDVKSIISNCTGDLNDIYEEICKIQPYPDFCGGSGTYRIVYVLSDDEGITIMNGNIIYNHGDETEVIW